MVEVSFAKAGKTFEVFPTARGSSDRSCAIAYRLKVTVQRKIEVVPYDPGWVSQFETEGKRISGVLGDTVARLHHIGSTAIPGISAKPIMDFLLVWTCHARPTALVGIIDGELNDVW